MSLRNERIKIHQAPLKSQFHGVPRSKLYKNRNRKTQLHCVSSNTANWFLKARFQTHFAVFDIGFCIANNTLCNFVST